MMRTEASWEEWYSYRKGYIGIHVEGLGRVRGTFNLGIIFRIIDALRLFNFLGLLSSMVRTP